MSLRRVMYKDEGERFLFIYWFDKKAVRINFLEMESEVCN